MLSRRVVLASTVISLTLMGFAQSRSSSDRTAQLIYLVNQSTITAYRVDSTTGRAWLLRGHVSIGSASAIDTIVATPDGRFVYVLWTDKSAQNHLWVYASEPSGALSRAPRQKLLQPLLTQFEVDPNGTFAYGLVSWTDASGAMRSNIRLFSINPVNGRLTESPRIEASYGPNFFYSAALDGFNSKGSKLYDVWSFSFDHELAAVYSYHPVNATTGTLQKDVQLFATSDYDSLDTVSISDRLLSETFGSIFDAWVNIYKNPPEYSNGSPVALIHCTAGMLDACGQSENALLDPRSENVFLIPLGTGNTVVAHIDLTDKRLVSTATIPGFAAITFSPNPNLVYAANWAYTGDSTITIYRFDPESGRLTQGSQIVTEAQALYPAQRQRGQQK